ncbi:MAG: YjbE family putative metal transport protein, partial [Magnetospirillum sp.]|nr:YjbE family putative metal transport protein [Magnetospirillum sp.]
IVIGIAAAAILRIVFAGFTVQLLQIVGLMLAGGLLLLWVSWKLWRELRRGAEEERAEAQAEAVLEGEDLPAATPAKGFRDAVTQIVIADVSMSLDNVLAVAGAAREHPMVLVIGLALSVALMGIAAELVARLLHRHRWIAYVGLAIILFVALRMIWDGTPPLLALAAGSS